MAKIRLKSRGYYYCREMMLKIAKIAVTPFEQNCRLVCDIEQGLAAVVDPGGEAENIQALAEREGVKIEQIWLTHSHLDHVGGVAELVRLTNAKVFGMQSESEMRAKVEDIVRFYGIPAGLMLNCPEPDIYISGGDTLSIGKFKFEVRFTPGHSPGHLVFYNAESKSLIAGDTLFFDSIGRTDLPGGDHETLLKSIKEQIFILPNETKVLPGHGADTTVGRERISNPYVKD